MPDDTIKDASPYPSAAEMDLDMWRAGIPERSAPRATTLSRIIWNNTNQSIVAIVPGGSGEANRDVMARRIEGIGDLYEALRRAAERMIAAGMDVSDEHRALTEFVSPKPFAEGQ